MKYLQLLISFIFSLIIIEFSIRNIYPQPVDAILYEEIFSNRFSESLGENIGSLKPKTSRTKNGVIFAINDDGLRDHDYEKIKNNNAYRIAIIGSSVNFGFNIELEKTFAKRLEKYLNENQQIKQYEVIIFGRPGFNSKEYFATFKDKVIEYNPDLIICSIVQNNLEKHSYQKFINRPIIDRKILINKQNQDFNWSDIKHSEIGMFIRSKFHLYLMAAKSFNNVYQEILISNGIKKRPTVDIDSLNNDFKLKIDNSLSWLDAIKNDCIKLNIKFSILLNPYEMQFGIDKIEKWRGLGYDLKDNLLELHYYKIIKNYCIKNEVYFFDVFNRLMSENNKGAQLYLDQDFAHYSSEGHDVVAQLLCKKIRDTLLQ